MRCNQPVGRAQGKLELRYEPRCRPRRAVAPRPAQRLDAGQWLVVSFYTGGDDLRGGSDNVNIKVTFKDNTTQTFSNVNRGGRWIDNSAEQVAVSVPTPSNVKSITISTTFGGGIGGDNWNLNRVVVHDLVTYKTGARRVDKVGAPLLKRFTGDSKTFTLTVD